MDFYGKNLNSQAKARQANSACRAFAVDGTLKMKKLRVKGRSECGRVPKIHTGHGEGEQNGGWLFNRGERMGVCCNTGGNRGALSQDPGEVKPLGSAVRLNGVIFSVLYNNCA